MRTEILPATYRGQKGYAVLGYVGNRKVAAVFLHTKTKSGAQETVRALKSGVKYSPMILAGMRVGK